MTSKPRSGPDTELDTEPDITRLGQLWRGPVDIRSLALTGLFVLAVLYAMAKAKPVLLPVVMAVLLSFLLAPLVATLSRWRVPRPLAAAVVLVALVVVAAFGVYQTVDPAQEWLVDAPRHLNEVEAKVRQAIRPVEQVGEAADRVGELAAVGDSAKETVEVRDKPSFGRSLVSGAQRFVVSATIVFGLVFFLLATEDLFLRKLVRVLPRLRDKKLAVEIARRIERDVSVHLATITSINVLLGVAVAIAMWLLGMPSPVLWGILAAAFNFVPYLGAAMGMFIVAVVALLSFDEVSRAVTVPVVYGLLTGLEGVLITPAILGRRLSLNPFVIFVGILFWGWIWGVPGALLAVPMLLVVKVFCDRVPPFTAVGEFLGR